MNSFEDIIQYTLVPSSVTIEENEEQWLRERVGTLEHRFRVLRQAADEGETDLILKLLQHWFISECY